VEAWGDEKVGVVGRRGVFVVGCANRQLNGRGVNRRGAQRPWCE